MDNLRELASRLAALSGEVASIRRSMATPQLPYSSLDDASVPEKDAEGNVVSRWGKQEDGTHGVVVYDGQIGRASCRGGVEGAGRGVRIERDTPGTAAVRRVADTQ